jgi:hypothetical protein
MVRESLTTGVQMHTRQTNQHYEGRAAVWKTSQNFRKSNIRKGRICGVDDLQGPLAVRCAIWQILRDRMSVDGWVDKEIIGKEI